LGFREATGDRSGLRDGSRYGEDGNDCSTTHEQRRSATSAACRANASEAQDGGGAPDGRHEPELHQQPVSESPDTIEWSEAGGCPREPAPDHGEPLAK